MTREYKITYTDKRDRTRMTRRFPNEVLMNRFISNNFIYMEDIDDDNPEV